MGLRIPQNQVVQSKYTAGKEYIIESTYREYIGYYYELNNKFFAGKELDLNAPLLIPFPKNNNDNNINKLLTNSATYVYGRISKTKILNNKVTSQPKSDTSTNTDKGGALFLQFFCKKINSNPILIKSIDEDTYIKLQKDPLYITTFIGTYNKKSQSIEEAEKQVPGIKDFVG
jgi:hypothetical protein